jgi:hypothetical protein
MAVDNIKWKIIYHSPNLQEVEILKAVCLDNHIQAVTINKVDSSYLSFGTIELYVPEDDFLRALQIIHTIVK